MRLFLKRTLFIALTLTLLFVVIVLIRTIRIAPDHISYGVSFSKYHADELGLSWREVYRALLDDMGVREFRLSAHWPMVEPEDDRFDFEVLDYQIREAEARGARVILSVGRRLPGWPECHEPAWARTRSWEERKREILEYMTAVVERYRGYENIAYWQVENEPFLTVFAYEHCGDLDTDFLDEEIALVRKLDPGRPILITDSGNLGLWYGPWRRGDAFGTSVYLYLWNPTLGPLKTIYAPFFYRTKIALVETLLGPREPILIELSLEPFLLAPIRETPIETQLDRMGMDKFNEAITFATGTGFAKQYLWGAEWWYYLREKGHPEFWDRAKELFRQP